MMRYITSGNARIGLRLAVDAETEDLTGFTRGEHIIEGLRTVDVLNHAGISELLPGGGL